MGLSLEVWAGLEAVGQSSTSVRLILRLLTAAVEAEAGLPESLMVIKASAARLVPRVTGDLSQAGSVEVLGITALRQE